MARDPITMLEKFTREQITFKGAAVRSPRKQLLFRIGGN